MRSTNKGPQFLPHRDLFEQLSKAALADIAWNLAALSASSADDPLAVFATFAREAKVTLSYRGDAVPRKIADLG